ncbi:MAG: Uma2 family endonuclease [Planctomycetota bacterium]
MSIVNAAAEQRVVFNNIHWETYLVLAAEDDRPGKRICYDQGVMEIMSPGMLHEHISALLGRMVSVFTEENDIEACSSAGTTFKRDDVERGFEADESYYIANEEAVRGKDEIDLSIDPPPDLAIEVDISRSSMSKFAIYRSIGVPELWRYDGNEILVYCLDESGEYARCDASRVLPNFPFVEAQGVLSRRHEESDTSLIKKFRDFVRSQNSSQDQ